MWTQPNTRLRRETTRPRQAPLGSFSVGSGGTEGILKAVMFPTRLRLAPCSCPSIGIGGCLATPPLPHHRAYGSVPRRFGGLRAHQRLHREQPMSLEAFVGEGAMQSARRAQPPRSLRAEDGRTGHLLGDLQAFELLVAPAARLPLDPDDATQPSPCPAVQRA